VEYRERGVLTVVVTALAPLETATLEQTAELARDYIAQSMVASTLRAHDIGWRQFAEWCEGYRLPVMPATPEIVALDIAECAETYKPATIGLRLTAISHYHQAAGHESPTHSLAGRKTLAGLRRSKGVAQTQKSALSVADLRQIVTEHLPHDYRGTLTPKGTRDRALILLGSAGAFRRSELVGLDVEDIEHVAEGMIVTLRRSKTDREGAGRKVGILHGNGETCPVQALSAWLAAARITEGLLFRPVDVWGNVAAERLSGHAVALVVKHNVAAIGRDATTFAGHSLRAAFATAAASVGAAAFDTMRQTGHRSLTMLRRYIRDGGLFRANAAARMGL
jgi:site-specific recombinase XerD